MNIPKRRIFELEGRIFMPQIYDEQFKFWKDVAGRVFYSRDEANQALNWYMCMMWDYYLVDGDWMMTRDKLKNGRHW